MARKLPYLIQTRVAVEQVSALAAVLISSLELSFSALGHTLDGGPVLVTT